VNEHDADVNDKASKIVFAYIGVLFNIIDAKSFSIWQW
jgi:hypothetical protein